MPADRRQERIGRRSLRLREEWSGRAVGTRAGPLCPAGDTSTSQCQAESAGVVTRRLRLEPNESAAASANRLRAAPNMVVRTGTAVRLRPGSNAIRTPAVAEGGN